MFAWLEARIWQIGTIAAGGTALILAGQLITVSIDQRRLDKQLNDPVTGYVVRYNQCHANETLLETKVTEQDAAIQFMADESATRLRAAHDAVDDAQRAATVASAKLKWISAAPVGTSTCERVLDIDKRFVEMLK